MKGCPIFPDPMLQESFIYSSALADLLEVAVDSTIVRGKTGWAIGAFATDIVTVNRLRNCPL